MGSAKLTCPSLFIRLRPESRVEIGASAPREQRARGGAGLGVAQPLARCGQGSEGRWRLVTQGRVRPMLVIIRDPARQGHTGVGEIKEQRLVQLDLNSGQL